uniref:Sodium/bile acid cotransporter-like n=1 Tax=Rhabditophanes sp. KR3021 TaxID=114890 RepID=A0AC35U4K5_9BILA
MLNFDCEDNYVCQVSPKYMLYNNVTYIMEEEKYTQNITILIKPTLIGITHLVMSIKNESDRSNTVISDFKFKVVKIKDSNLLGDIFICLLVSFGLFVSLIMGTQIEIPKLHEIIRNPKPVLISTSIQFIVLPLLGYLMTQTLIVNESNLVKFSLFACSCSPGGGKSSIWTYLFDGNLNLSVSMTLVQTIVAMGAMPFWIHFLGSQFLESENIQVPYSALFKSIITLVVPVGIGMLIIRYRPRLAEIINDWAKSVTLLMTIAITILGIVLYYDIFWLFNLRMFIAGTIIPWSGYVIAYLTSKIFNLNVADKITTAIETGIQNIGFPVMIILLAFEEPEISISMCMPIIIGLMTDKPLITLYLYLRCIKKNLKSKKPFL